MEIQVRERVYNIDALRDMFCQGKFADKRYELIDGELMEMAPTSWGHGLLAGEIAHYLRTYVKRFNLGVVPGSDPGYYSPIDESTLLVPDVAFVSYARMPPARSAKEFAPLMPDLAVEIKSPSESMPQMRRKARIYLENGSCLVWLVLPDKQAVEVWRLSLDGQLSNDRLERSDSLSGEDVLPGFSLDLQRLFT